MRSDLDQGRESPPHHTVLQEPWTYALVGLSFRCNPASQSASILELTLQRAGETVHLRFLGVHGLEITDDFPWRTGGLQILDITARGMEQARVQVCSFEQEQPIRFWARDVERVGA